MFNDELFTVEEIIAKFDEEFPNQIPSETKIGYLKSIERIIHNEVMETHEIPLLMTFGHFDDWGVKSELYVTAPYEDLYLYYIGQRDAISKNETKRYNTFSSLYNNAMVTYQGYMNRTYRPKSKKSPLFQHNSI